MQQKDGKKNFLPLWAVLGPAILLLTFFVQMVEAGVKDLVIPLLAFLGIPVCWKWKIPGLFATIATFVLYTLLIYTNLPIEGRFWQVATTMAMILALVVTTLSFEEVEAQVDALDIESQSRLDNLCRIDEKLKTSQEKWQEERQDLSRRLQELSKDLEERITRIATFERVISIVRRDLETAYSEHQRLQKELFSKNQELTRQKQSNVELKAEINELGEGTTVSALRETLLNKIALLNFWRCEKFQENLLLKKDNENFLEERRKKNKAEGMYKQLREQFSEKNTILAETRKELFHLKEKVLLEEKKQQEASMVGASEVQKLLEKKLLAMEDEQQQLIKENNEEVTTLQDLVGSLMKQLAEKES